ncbi:MAG: hypothetical protein WD382_02845 [Halofilum sp. (in: g-proteobacteria)]
MSAIHLTARALTERERNDRLYAGEIIIFRGFGAVAALTEHLAASCRRHLGDEPETVHQRLAEEVVNESAGALQHEVRQDARIAQMVNEALAAVGVDIERTFGDGLKQRVQMASSRSGARAVSPLGAHRDTWGSNIMAQTNWWAPVYPVTPERTLAMFPTLFDRPVANDSDGWDFRELLRRLKQEGPEPDYPLLPLASTAPDWREALPISIEHGDLLCFSGAHLHASVPNTTDRTRFSWELRTANGDDVAAGRGARNVDGHPVRTTYQLFRGLSSGERLGEMA